MTLAISRTTNPTSIHSTPSLQRVLVMDDNANLRYLYMQALHEAGYEAYPAKSLQEARDLLATYHFDVFLADTHIGNRAHGASLLREKFVTFVKNNTKIIMTSTNTQYQAICQEMGTDLFIEKPVAVDRLVGMVNHLTAQRSENLADQEGGMDQ